LRAEAAYQRKDYLMCNELAEQARSTLRQTKAGCEIDTFEEIASRPAEPDTEQIPPFQETKKLPQNYLESKFMIECARMSIDTASKQGSDMVEAERMLAIAMEHYDRTEYTEALKHALRAKRTAEGQKVSVQPETRPPEAGKEEPKAPIEVPGKADCGNCGQPVDESDNFCRKCGTKIVRVPRCPSCSSEVDEGDAFCRKCGAKLK
jgi:hypothetical protein